jgi:aminomethyltransferase
MRALRRSAGISRPTHVAIVRVQGPDAFDLLQHASTRPLHLREGQLRHTLFLRDDAGIFADVLVASTDDGYCVLAEGPTEDDLAAWLTRTAETRRMTLHGLSATHVVRGIDGPYAWEAAARILGPAVLGVPYLTLMRREDVVCFRAGKTGEYGYTLVVPRDATQVIDEKLATIAPSLDMEDVTLDALDLCALENWHFSIRALRETKLARPLTPIELQLQWRVSYAKEFPGANALRARRADGAKVRATAITADGPLAPGDALRIADDDDAGEVLAAAFSPLTKTWVGIALLSRRLAHPHVELIATTAQGTVRATTRTTPIVDNESLRVDPHKHTFATRSARETAPVVTP